MARNVTQRQVAVAAGVSQSAVSLILSGAGERLPTETHDRVHAAVVELGYVTDQSAQRLRTRRTRTIACVVPDITNPYYPALERGVQEVAAAAGYDVIAINTDGIRDRERHLIKWGREHRVDGVIGVFFTLSRRELSVLVDEGVAVLRIEAQKKEPQAMALDAVFTDNRRAAKEAVEYLIGRGHRRITMLTVEAGPGPERAAGYAMAMAGAKLSVQVEVEDSFTPEAGSNAISRLLSQSVRPTAVFAANDMMALGALTTLQERGVRVPDDVAVLGFDDIEAARWVRPALTTVNQFQRELGRASATMMLERLRALPRTTPGRQREMPFQLVIRDSA
jgi:LacI family transcriptional regulator